MTPDHSRMRIPRRTRALVLAAATGDAAVFLLFAAAGRTNHAESRSVLHVVGTALPFIVGWLLAAIALRAFAHDALTVWSIAARRTALAWVIGALIALSIRSALEREVVPIAFVLVAVTFNLVLLLIWRVAFAYLLGPRSAQEHVHDSPA